MTVSADPYVHVATGRFVVLTCNVEPSSELAGVYVATCPALGVTSQGDSLEEAENNIREAVSLYLTAIDEDGELDRVFNEKGLRISVAADAHMAFKLPAQGGGSILAEAFPIDRAA